MNPPPDLTIDIVSDLVCPWCYVGKKKLEMAVQMVSPAIHPRIRWHPFQLDPSIPREGTDRRRYMLGKFGSEEKLRQVHHRIEQIGASLGIGFRFDEIEVSPNTLDAHRLLRWAGQYGDDVQNRLAGLLFASYFEEGANVGDARVLAEAARRAGMDAAHVAARLATDEDCAAVEQEIEAARRIGVTGVPCFIFNGRTALVGAQEPEQIVEAIAAAGNS